VRDDQRRDLTAALLKVAGVAVGIGLVLAIGVFVMVRALGFSDSTPAAHSTSSPDAPLSTLPTRALSPSGSPSASATASSSPTSTPSKPPGIMLAASPVQVPPGGRINLTGTYPGADNVSLQVQRKEGGTWTPFANVTAPVRVSAFATYVITSRTGKMSFRVLDPATGRASNAVQVTVG
jgi:cytoskeletal protein RodZ